MSKTATKMDEAVFYRYEARLRGGFVGEDDYTYGGTIHLDCLHFYVVAKTPQGCWLAVYKGGKKWKWVSNTSRKRYAYPTENEALDAYIIRTERRISILQTQLEHCATGLVQAKNKI